MIFATAYPFKSISESTC